MGNVIQSLALTSLFPKTTESFDALEQTMRYLEKRHKFRMVEFYTAPGRDEEIARLFKELGFTSILIGVLALKGAGYSLCALDEEERQKAVAVLKNCIDRAAVIGSKSVMINSGFIPENAELTQKSCESYIRSVLEAVDYIDDTGSDVSILLEPGDSGVQSFQLLGPTERVLKTTAQIREKTDKYALTMDVAHIREENEEVMASLAATAPYCSHVHLCNCVMEPSHPLYGDKHVDFDCENACFDYGDFERMFGDLRKLLSEKELTVALEITCRAPDNFAWFDQVAERCSWLFV